MRDGDDTEDLTGIDPLILARRDQIAACRCCLPCPKPVAWMRWAISRGSRVNETILDPFMGSGTTGVAAVKLGRKFIGIEIEERYFSIACRRISDALKQPDMFIDPPKVAEQMLLIPRE